ncbi:hypothetical protein CROQUDRAFT_131035 [Cronartium quercuum f. sp. fusiforme G11]|uniref:BZIP domain-containing protein n=1 Tax=Cronartium quercuum f. sp. fusiforme G11 TaxID=708437 RepID=A0A9P6NTB2_9BASI|nr:hypothetical protein CROQUDRAFT_131035 [Cronartium quercuum f. sp. fusiforme G11]
MTIPSSPTQSHSKQTHLELVQTHSTLLNHSHSHSHSELQQWPLNFSSNDPAGTQFLNVSPPVHFPFANTNPSNSPLNFTSLSIPSSSTSSESKKRGPSSSDSLGRSSRPRPSSAHERPAHVLFEQNQRSLSVSYPQATFGFPSSTPKPESGYLEKGMSSPEPNEKPDLDKVEINDEPVTSLQGVEQKFWKRKITEKRREQNRIHQRAYRERRDLALKQKDLEIATLKEEVESLREVVGSSQYQWLGALPNPVPVNTVHDPAQHPTSLNNSSLPFNFGSQSTRLYGNHNQPIATSSRAQVPVPSPTPNDRSTWDPNLSIPNSPTYPPPSSPAQYPPSSSSSFSQFGPKSSSPS